MTSLDQLVIEHIEKSSGVELPQEDRTIVQEIISKHEFDEESARLFGEFYVNVNYKLNLHDSIRTLLNNSLIDESYVKLKPFWIKKTIPLLDIIAKFYSNKDFSQKELSEIKEITDTIEHEIWSITYFISEAQNVPEDYALHCLLAFEKLVVINANALFPGIYDDNNRFFNTFTQFIDSPPYYHDENGGHTIGDIREVTIKLLNLLSEFRSLDGKIVNPPEGFGILIHPEYVNDALAENRIKNAIEFLSRHNPEKESLSEVLPKLMDCVTTEIPDYEVIDFLGEGAFKKVYLARSKIDPDKYVAVAVFDPEHIRKAGRLQLSRIGSDLTPEALENAIKREFQPSKLDKIKHPHKENIINIHHVGRTEKFAYITYTPYDINLKGLLAKKQKIDFKQINKILLSIASGLAGCHESGVIHRDLHAGNIGLMLNEDVIERAILSDFGQMSEFSFEQDKEHSQISPLQTRPPEQFLSKEEFERYKTSVAERLSRETNVDFELQKKANVFNFGCIAYQIITGRVPFWPRNPDGTLIEDPLGKDSGNLPARQELEQTIQQTLEKEKDSKGSYKKFLERDPAFKKAPRYMRNLITKCLMYDPKDRYDNFDKIYKCINNDTPTKKALKLIFGKDLTHAFYRLAFATAVVVLGNYIAPNDDELVSQVSIAGHSIVRSNEEIEVEFSVRQLEDFPQFNVFYHDETKIKDTSKFTGASSVPVEIISSHEFEQDYIKGRIIRTRFDSEGIKTITLESLERSEEFPNGRVYGAKKIIVLDNTNERSEISNFINVQRDFLDRNKLTVSIDEVQLFNYAQQLGITRNSFTRGLYWIAINNKGNAVQKSENFSNNLNSFDSMLLGGSFFSLIKDKSWFVENYIDDKTQLSDIYLIIEKDGKMLFGRKLASEIYRDPNSNAELQGFILAAENKYFILSGGTKVYCLRVLKNSNGNIMIDNRVDFCEWDFRDPDLNRNKQKVGVSFPSSGVHRLNVTALDNTENNSESSAPHIYNTSIDFVVEEIEHNWYPISLFIGGLVSILVIKLGDQLC